MGFFPEPARHYWDWLTQTPLPGDSAPPPPLAITFSEVSVVPPNSIIVTAIVHGILAILGALSIALAYYCNSVMKRPGAEVRYRRNAGLIFLRSLLPAPVAGFLSVASINRLAPYTTGDYRYEWAVVFAAGTVATAIIKKLSAGLLAPERLPYFNHSAPESGEENQ